MLLRLLVGLVMLGGLLPQKGQAMWAKLQDAELIAQSSVIVMAELIGETQITLPAQDTALRLGVLQVTETLQGSGLPPFLLLVLPSATGLRSSTDIVYHSGQRGVWFLRPSPAAGHGLYLADHPQRFLSAAESQAQIATIRQLLTTR